MTVASLQALAEICEAEARTRPNSQLHKAIAEEARRQANAAAAAETSCSDCGTVAIRRCLGCDKIVCIQCAKYVHDCRPIAKPEESTFTCTRCGQQYTVESATTYAHGEHCAECDTGCSMCEGDRESMGYDTLEERAIDAPEPDAEDDFDEPDPSLTDGDVPADYDDDDYPEF